jgi:hypothetical protein
MKFEPLPQLETRTTRLVYRQNDHAIVTVPPPPSSGVSLAFNEVQVDLTEDGRFSSVSGFCPKQSWQHISATPPPFVPGELRVVGADKLIPGVSVRVSPQRLPVMFCASSWLCLGTVQDSDATYRIQFAPGAGIVGTPDRLIALWLHLTKFE